MHKLSHTSLGLHTSIFVQHIIPVFYISFHHSFTNQKVFVPLLHISFADLGCLSSFSPFLVHFLGFYQANSNQFVNSKFSYVLKLSFGKWKMSKQFYKSYVHQFTSFLNFWSFSIVQWQFQVLGSQILSCSQFQQFDLFSIHILPLETCQDNQIRLPQVSLVHVCTKGSICRLVLILGSDFW